MHSTSRVSNFIIFQLLLLLLLLLSFEEGEGKVPPVRDAELDAPDSSKRYHEF